MKISSEKKEKILHCGQNPANRKTTKKNRRKKIIVKLY